MYSIIRYELKQIENDLSVRIIMILFASLSLLSALFLSSYKNTNILDLWIMLFGGVGKSNTSVAQLFPMLIYYSANLSIISILRNKLVRASLIPLLIRSRSFGAWWTAQIFVSIATCFFSHVFYIAFSVIIGSVFLPFDFTSSEYLLSYTQEYALLHEDTFRTITQCLAGPLVSVTALSIVVLNISMFKVNDAWMILFCIGYIVISLPISVLIPSATLFFFGANGALLSSKLVNAGGSLIGVSLLFIVVLLTSVLMKRFHKAAFIRNIMLD